MQWLWQEKVKCFEKYFTLKEDKKLKLTTNPEYYKELVSRLGVSAEHCLMVGNDVTEDMEAAQEAGMSVFLLTDCLINKERKDISAYTRGSFEQLLDYARNFI